MKNVTKLWHDTGARERTHTRLLYTVAQNGSISAKAQRISQQ